MERAELAGRCCEGLWLALKRTGGWREEVKLRGSYTTKPRKTGPTCPRGARKRVLSCRNPKANLLATVVAYRLQGLYSTSWAWWPVLKNCREGRWERAL